MIYFLGQFLRVQSVEHLKNVLSVQYLKNKTISDNEQFQESLVNPSSIKERRDNRERTERER